MVDSGSIFTVKAKYLLWMRYMAWEKEAAKDALRAFWNCIYWDGEPVSKEKIKIEFGHKIKNNIFPSSRMSKGVTFCLSWDAMKMKVKEHKYPMMKRMREVNRWHVSISLQKKKMKREEWVPDEVEKTAT